MNENVEITKEKVNESKIKIKEYLERRKNTQDEAEIIDVELLALIENVEESKEV